MKLNKLMFREYDIRGIWNEDITEEISYHIGRAYATKLLSFGKNKMIVGYDNRLSSPFCNFEKATKERLIFSQCLEKLEELEQGSDE